MRVPQNGFERAIVKQLGQEALDEIWNKLQALEAEREEREMAQTGGKIGEGIVKAHLLHGAAELGNAFVNPGANVAQNTHSSIWGQASHHAGDKNEMAAEPKLDEQRWEQEGGSVLRERLDRAEQAGRDGHDREPKDIDHERD